MTRWAILAVALTLSLSLSGCHENEPPASAARPVQTMTVGAHETGTVTSYAGQIEAQHESQQGFRVNGTVTKWLTDVGDHVSAGQPLLQLDPSDLEYQKTQAQAQLEAARHQTAQARIDLDRSKSLVAQNFISQARYDQSKLDYQQAQANLKAARAAYGEAVNALEYGTLRAAVAGVIIAINVEVGEVVRAGQDAVDIARDGDREVRISVPESRVGEIQRAQGLTVTLWANPEKRYSARLRRLDPDTSAKSSTYEGHVVLVDPDARVRLGMTAYVHVPATTGDGSYAVPLTAVYHSNGSSRVWVVNKNSTVSARTVKVQALTGNSALLSTGVKPGDVVVTAGVEMLHEGEKVNPVGTYFPQSS